MPRASMAELIARLRVVSGDPAGASQTFTDDELQAFLDERRSDVALAILAPDDVLSGSPLVFRAAVRYWESDAVLADGSGGVLTPDEDGTDPVAGVWAFLSAQSGSVYITGRAYDLYGSANAVLTAWAAKVATQFDFTTDGQNFARSQKATGLLSVAREVARRAIPAGMRPNGW